MYSRPSDPQLIIRQLREEIQRRKATGGSVGATTELEATRPMALRDAAEERKHQLQRDERLKVARAALERAIMKHEAANSWPRFLRVLRRDQAAVNESLIGAVRAVLHLLDTGK